MTPEESQMLNDLADKIAKTPSPAHDAEAEQFIRTRIGSRPDALYIMTQTVLIQNMAIEHARQQIQELQQRAAPGGSMLGAARPQQAAPPAPAPPPPAGYSQAPPPYQPPPPSYQPPPPSGMSGFLRSAASTAAGVAAGALAFEGIRSLFGGMGHPGGEFGGFGGGGMGSGFLGNAPGSETIINNYYDSPGESGRDDTTSADADAQDSGGQDASGDAGDSGQTDDSGATGADDSGGDDSGATDSGGTDTGGGTDSGGGDWT